MNIYETTITKVRISKYDDLDNIHVYIDQTTGSAGRIVIDSFGDCWSAYWGNTGGKTIQDFFIGLDDDYILECLIKRTPTTRSFQHRTIKKIIVAVKDAFTEMRVAVK